MKIRSKLEPAHDTFLRSRAGRAWGLMLGLILLSSIAIGVALYSSNIHWFETNKAEETATALRLVEALVANYTEVRAESLGEDAPVPAEFRAHSMDLYNASRQGDHQLQMGWLGVPGRQIATAPDDDATAKAIRRAATTGQTAPSSEWLTRNDQPVYRTIAPSVASQQACIDCHNQYVSAGPLWQLGDVMGAFVIDVPAAGFMATARRDAILSASLLFVFMAAVSGCIQLLQHRRDEAEKKAAVSAERERAAFEGRRLAEAASRAKSRFLAMMSHELRTPLNAILGFSEVMTRETMGPIPPRYADYAQDIHKSGQHLLTVISDVLDLARAESGHLRLSEEDTTLGEAIGPCLRLITPRARVQQIAISAELPESLNLRVDQTKLRQTVLNLLSNAVKYTREGGRIDVSAELLGDGSLAIVVADTGVGMHAEDIPKTLIPFERLEGAEQIEGTGLGLPLAKVLAELHGGSLQLESTPNVGTRVTLILPAERVLTGAGAAAGIPIPAVATAP